MSSQMAKGLATWIGERAVDDGGDSTVMRLVEIWYKEMVSNRAPSEWLPGKRCREKWYNHLEYLLIRTIYLYVKS